MDTSDTMDIPVDILDIALDIAQVIGLFRRVCENL